MMSIMWVYLIEFRKAKTEGQASELNSSCHSSPGGGCLGDVLARMEIFKFFRCIMHQCDVQMKAGAALPSLNTARYGERHSHGRSVLRQDQTALGVSGGHAPAAQHRAHPLHIVPQSANIGPPRLSMTAGPTPPASSGAATISANIPTSIQWSLVLERIDNHLFKYYISEGVAIAMLEAVYNVFN